MTKKGHKTRVMNHRVCRRIKGHKHELKAIKHESPSVSSDSLTRPSGDAFAHARHTDHPCIPSGRGGASGGSWCTRTVSRLHKNHTARAHIAVVGALDQRGAAFARVAWVGWGVPSRVGEALLVAQHAVAVALRVGALPRGGHVSQHVSQHASQHVSRGGTSCQSCITDPFIHIT